MALSGEEIRQRLSAFAARWSVYDRSERAEAQTFLNELFACYGQDRSKVATFEEPQSGKFLDLIWPRVCIFEMKAPAEAKRLKKHRAQALHYWKNAADPEKGIETPRWVVLCAFRHLEIWEPGRFPNEPRVEMDLVDLPDQYDALQFLAGEEPVFLGGHAAVTREAVKKVTDLHDLLKDRRAAESHTLRDFLLQSVWCMFAEDLGQIPGHRFTQIVDGLIASPHRSSADDLGQMFTWLNDSTGTRPERGLYTGMPYANGGLFEEPAHVDLKLKELEMLREACDFNWRQVQPSIFGSLLEGGLGHDMQWRLGAHYTHEADIQKVVQPTIVRPWRERIETLKTHKEAVAAQNDLMDYVVLDPACGSGNFLYVAYRELRRLEQRLREREAELRKKAGMKEQGSMSGLFFPLSNMRGIEIEPFAVSLARVTLWMGHKLAVDELGLSEATLPLESLSGIQTGDALRADWPRADAIIGNPPFHGSQNLRGELGDPYVEWLSKEFGVGIKDYCVYWFRKAQDELEPGTRAGLVGTNSISQNRARGVSLNYIAENGGVITDAVSKQVWPGEAVVNVSIVNWTKQPAEPPKTFILDGVEVQGIGTRLEVSTNATDEVARLSANKGYAFQGPMPVGAGFLLDAAEAESLLADTDYRSVVRPFIVSDDVANDPRQRPTRFIIDFGLRPLEEAANYPLALRILEERVREERKGNADRFRRENWWLLGRPVKAMRKALGPLDRYIVGTRLGKRILFCWGEPWTCPSDAVNVFAFQDDYSMAILQSRVHLSWAKRESSTMRVDPRYTPTSAFETFAWPDPTDGQRDEIGALANQLIGRRQEICVEREIGLTTLYNQMDDGAWADLKDLHRQLDEAVAAAYGWPKSAAHDPDDSNARLRALNAEISSGEREYDPFRVLEGTQS